MYSVLDYVSGITSYVFDKSVLLRVIYDRKYKFEDSADTITEQDKELLLADLLYIVFCGANSSASYSVADGSFKQAIGSQTINSKKEIYNIIKGIYTKYSDPKLEVINESIGVLTWINECD